MEFAAGEKNTARGRVVLVLLLLLYSTGVACKFKSPTITQGQEFARSGAFPSHVPAWVKAPPDSKTTVVRSGIVPLGYAAPQAVQSQRETMASADLELSFAEKRQEYYAQRRQFEAKRIEAARDAEPDSPLARIEKLCPGLESAVIEAMRTTSLNQRTQKYQALTNRCPESVDLLVWLARDYSAQGMSAQARQTADRALGLDPKNQEALSLSKQLDGAEK